MNTYLTVFMVATLATVTLTPLVRRACERLGWLDQPGEARRVHRSAVPRLGGVAVVVGVLAAVAPLAFVDTLPAQALRERLPELRQALAPAALAFLFGLYDDLRPTRAPHKLAVLVCCGVLFYALGGRIELLSVPLFGAVELPGLASLALTVLWVVAVANAFNLIDGVDGLASGAALFAALVMLVVALMLGHPLVALLACALCGALVGFLRYNFNPASIFLGDSGALFVGCFLAVLSVQGAQKASTAVAVAIPLLAFGVPVVDTGFTLVRRFVSGRPLLEGDREHIHHMLLARGWSQKRVVVVLYAACALFGMAALFFVNDTGRMTGLLLLIVGAAVVLAVGRLRYHEVDELKAGVRRNIGERRARTANNVRVRRAVRLMSEAATLGDLLDALRGVLELGEFVGARACFSAGYAARARAAVSARGGEASLPGVSLDAEGSVWWEWERGDAAAALARASGACWTLRLPLSTARGEWGYVNFYRALEADGLLLDINYLCQPFRRETAAAAERIFGGPLPSAHREGAQSGGGASLPRTWANSPAALERPHGNQLPPANPA
ncbi:MAG TPA: MraY family glycosyltransferase [Pyrinomonadaceae bacterium]|jgi:UDP-GlcNAc:undecaprenyl-phosphate GlcNAc-1-phosphate transferase